MGRKKKDSKPLKPFCYYCDREFDDEKVLFQHQKVKHFKCHHCHRKLSTASGLVIHVLQVHKETINKVPNAIPGRDSTEVEICGMEGVPQEALDERQGNPAKRQKVDDVEDDPVNPPPNPYGAPAGPPYTAYGQVQPAPYSAGYIPPAGYMGGAPPPPPMYGAPSFGSGHPRPPMFPGVNPLASQGWTQPPPAPYGQRLQPVFPIQGASIDGHLRTPGGQPSPPASGSVPPTSGLDASGAPAGVSLGANVPSFVLVYDDETMSMEERRATLQVHSQAVVSH